MKTIFILALFTLSFLIEENKQLTQNKNDDYDWRFLTKTFWYNVYYDYKTLGMFNNSIFVFLKYVPLPSQIDTVIWIRKYSVQDDPELFKKYDDFAYSIQGHIWECQYKLNAIFLFYDYDKNNQIIQSYAFPLDSSSWFNLEGDEYGEQMIKAICKLRAVIKNKSKSNK